MTQRRRRKADDAPATADVADAASASQVLAEPGPATVGRRRRRGATDQPMELCTPGNTAPEPGDERWEGDPEEPEPFSGAAESEIAPALTPAAALEKPKPLPPVVTAPMPSAKDRHPLPWGLVITDVFNLDVHKTYARLEEELSLGDGASEYGTVLRAVDASAKNLFEAARLARKAKLEDERFAAELDKRLEVLRTEAARGLEAEKQSGQRSKAPTLKDIEDRMLSNWPDEMLSIRARKAEMHGALRTIEALEVAWRERCGALRTLATQFARAGA